MDDKNEFQKMMEELTSDTREKLNKTTARKALFQHVLSSEAIARLDRQIKILRKEKNARAKALATYKKYSK